MKFHRTALSRQTGEAIRIRRRGGEGAVLNSKGEFNRSFIPRLQLVEEEKIVEMEQAEQEDLRMAMEELESRDATWEQDKTRMRRGAAKKGAISNTSGAKRVGGSREARPSKKRKFDLIPRGWGSLTMTEIEAKTTCQEGAPDMVVRLVESGGEPPDKVVRETNLKDGQDQQDHPQPRMPGPPTILTIPGWVGDKSGRDEEQSMEAPYNDDGLSSTTTHTEGGASGETGNDDIFVNEIMRTCDDDRVKMMSKEVSPGDGDDIKVMGDDIEDTHTLYWREENETPTPSSSEADNCAVRKGDHQDSVSVSVPDSGRQDCKIVDGKCVNGCKTKTISYTVKKRVRNKKTLLWYDRSVKITKPICMKTKNDAQSNLAKGSER